MIKHVLHIFSDIFLVYSVVPLFKNNSVFILQNYHRGIVVPRIDVTPRKRSKNVTLYYYKNMSQRKISDECKVGQPNC